jgi:DNA-binding PadR family transcriptional regulator
MVNGLPDVARVVFDDERVVANAGVLLPAVLAGRLGIEAVIDRTVDLGDRAGAANAGGKVMSLETFGRKCSGPDKALRIPRMYDSDDREMAEKADSRRELPSPGRLEGKAPVKAATLAVLLEAPGHGYDVAKRINRRMGSWAVDPKHIYEPLKQLEKAGLVWSREEPIAGPPGFRKVYYPTEAAKQARLDWFGSPPAMSVLRADIHARVAFSDEEDAPALLRALGEYRTDLLEAIEENARAWAAPKGSWLGFVIGHLRDEVDKQCKAEIEWANGICKDLKEHLAGRSAR